MSIGVSISEEAVLIEVVACYLRYAVAQHEVALHGRAAQVKVAALQTDLVTDFLVSSISNGVVSALDRMRMSSAMISDLAGRHLLVDSSRVARDQLAP